MDKENVLFVLGASDPEMEAIEGLLRDHQVPYGYAALMGKRVAPSNAYGATGIIFAVERGPRDRWLGTHYVECAPEDGYPAGAVVIDHHSPGHYGYQRPPEEFWEASSLGQTVAELRKLGCEVEVTEDLRLTAAADHCPAAAYRGRCPGIDPEALMRHRASVRAAFQRRPVEELLADVIRGCDAIQQAPMVLLGAVEVADLRGRTVPELPEASLRSGVPVLAAVIERDGRRKIVLLGDENGDAVRAFLEGWAAAEGLVQLYGSPARGFAGGYIPQ